MTVKTEMPDLSAQPITLNLTAGEVNFLLHTLSQRPFAEVANLIGKIKTQGDAQFVPPPPLGSEPADDSVN